MIKCCSLVSAETYESWLGQTFSISKNQIKKNIQNKTKLGQEVQYQDELNLPLNICNYMRINPIYTGKEIKILHEDDQFLVISKPEMIHSHPLSYDESDNVLSFLRSERYFQCLQVNSDSYDRSLLYRLDFETSGLLVLLKNSSTYQFLRTNFHSQIKEKTYLAICSGHYDREGMHQHYFKKSGLKGSKQKVFDTHEPESQLALFETSLIKYDSSIDKSLVLVKLKTGLRHQIRAQLAHLGFPILGDELYGGVKDQRMYLHAYEYQIELNKKKYIFKDPTANLFSDLFNLNGLI